MTTSNDFSVAMRLLLERASVPAGRAVDTHLVVDLEPSGEGIEHARPPLSVAFVLDVSSSMSGPPLEHVQGSVNVLLDLLDPDDRVCVIAFADAAAEVAPLRALEPAWRHALKQRVRRLGADGCTNLSAGLELARDLLGARTLHERQLVVVLTDGQPNRGVSDADGLCRLVSSMRPDIATVALGYGPHHAEDLLARIAEAGSGEYFYIADPLESDEAFGRAIGAQGDVIADAVELSFSPAEGAAISGFVTRAQPVFGPRGLTVAMPDLYAGRARHAVVKLALTGQHPGAWRALDVRLGYRPAGSAERRAVIQTLEVAVTRSDGPGALVPEAHMRVLLAESELARAEARALADRGHYDGAAAVIRKIIERLEAAPGYQPGDGTPLSEAVEQLVDERTAYERRPSAESYRDFKRMSLGVDMQAGGVHHSEYTLHGAKAQRISAGAQGDLPPAYLEVERKGEPPRIAPLRGDAMIGRVHGNDIVLPQGNISKRHARLIGRNGKYILVDMKSTSGTYVDGKILSAPHALAPGDKIYIGHFLLRYREGDPPDE